MPLYDFQCLKCKHTWDELTSYDEKGLYEKIICPECNSDKKQKLATSRIAIVGPTSSKMDNFGYRAGYNLERAKGERRAAEEATGGASSPYRDMSSDFNLGEGVHDPETRLGLG